MILKNLNDKENKVDMSSRAITTRLQRVSQLRRLCISLSSAETVKPSDAPSTPYKTIEEFETQWIGTLKEKEPNSPKDDEAWLDAEQWRI